MKNLKTAVIGLGNMGQHHARHYAALSHLVAVCDEDSVRVEECVRRYGCKGYRSVEDLLENESIDALSIAVPTFLHYDIAKKVISKNISVLIEKPISDSIENAKELDLLAQQHKVTLMVGHIERFNPIITTLKKEIEAGVLGEIASIITRRVSPMPTQIKDDNVMIDLAVHDIDVCSYLLDKNPQHIIGRGGRLILKDREDHAELLLDYGTCNAMVQVNWITPIKIRTLSITGSKAHAEVNYLTQEMTIYSPNQEAQLIKLLSQESLPIELAHFLNAVKTKTKPLVGAKEGIAALVAAQTSLT